MNNKTIFTAVIENKPARSAWTRGITAYALHSSTAR